MAYAICIYICIYISVWKAVWSKYTLEPLCFVQHWLMLPAGIRRPSNAEMKAVADLRLGDGTALGSVKGLQSLGKHSALILWLL